LRAIIQHHIAIAAIVTDTINQVGPPVFVITYFFGVSGSIGGYWTSKNWPHAALMLNGLF